MDIVETDGEYRVEMDLPGVALDNVEVKLGPVRGSLAVSASAPASRESGVRVVHAERSARGGLQYARTIPVAWDADIEKAQKYLTNGVLVVTIPRIAPRNERAGAGSRDK